MFFLRMVMGQHKIQQFCKIHCLDNDSCFIHCFLLIQRHVTLLFFKVRVMQNLKPLITGNCLPFSLNIDCNSMFAFETRRINWNSELILSYNKFCFSSFFVKVGNVIIIIKWGKYMNGVVGGGKKRVMVVPTSSSWYPLVFLAGFLRILHEVLQLGKTGQLMGGEGLK